MRVGNTAITCTRVSALQIYSGDLNKKAIVGWYEDPGDLLFNGTCQATSGKPRVLRVKYANGTWTCDNSTAEYDLNQGQSQDDTFWVHDSDQDGTWEYFRNGNSLGSYSFGSLVHGFAANHTERFEDSNDSMYANYDQLKRMGAGSNWNNWTGTIQTADNDAEYDACILSDEHTEVRDPACP